MVTNSETGHQLSNPITAMAVAVPLGDGATYDVTTPFAHAVAVISGAQSTSQPSAASGSHNRSPSAPPISELSTEGPAEEASGAFDPGAFMSPPDMPALNISGLSPCGNICNNDPRSPPLPPATGSRIQCRYPEPYVGGSGVARQSSNDVGTLNRIALVYLMFIFLIWINMMVTVFGAEHLTVIILIMILAIVLGVVLCFN